MLALIFGSTCLYAAAALALAVRMFKRESVLFRA
jgi:sodium transport system permease protein